MSNWQSVQLQWPAKSTAWLSELSPVEQQITETESTTIDNLDALAGLTNFQPSELSKTATEAVAKAEQAINSNFAQTPQAIVVTPFTFGVATGRGYHRYLSAPNVIDYLASKLDDGGDPERPNGQNLQAIAVIFLSNTYGDLEKLLHQFNALLPIYELQKAERRASYLNQLEQDRQIMAEATSGAKWQTLPLQGMTIVKRIKDSLTAQLASLQGYIEQDPLATLSELLAEKQQTAIAQQQAIADLKATLAEQTEQQQILACYCQGGITSDIRRELLSISDMPSYEWILCAGLLLVGEATSLAFIRELLSL